jgi:hypothetical protein
MEIYDSLAFLIRQSVREKAGNDYGSCVCEESLQYDTLPPLPAWRCGVNLPAICFSAYCPVRQRDPQYEQTNSCHSHPDKFRKSFQLYGKVQERTNIFRDFQNK